MRRSQAVTFSGNGKSPEFNYNTRWKYNTIINWDILSEKGKTVLHNIRKLIKINRIKIFFFLNKNIIFIFL